MVYLVSFQFLSSTWNLKFFLFVKKVSSDEGKKGLTVSFLWKTVEWSKMQNVGKHMSASYGFENAQTDKYLNKLTLKFKVEVWEK
jgi:hypothetical protein